MSVEACLEAMEVSRSLKKKDAYRKPVRDTLTGELVYWPEQTITERFRSRHEQMRELDEISRLKELEKELFNKHREDSEPTESPALKGRAWADIEASRTTLEKLRIAHAALTREVNAGIDSPMDKLD